MVQDDIGRDMDDGRDDADWDMWSGEHRETEEERVGSQPVKQTSQVERELDDGSVVRETITDHTFLDASGDIVTTPDGVAGLCAICVEASERVPFVSKENAAHCARCGVLLCLRHQGRVIEQNARGEDQEVVLCPAHGIRWDHASFGCFVVLASVGLVLALLLRGCLT